MSIKLKQIAITSLMALPLMACGSFKGLNDNFKSASSLRTTDIETGNEENDNPPPPPPPVEKRYIGVQAGFGGRVSIDGQLFQSRDGLKTFEVQGGQRVSLSAYPLPGYKFLGFLSDGACKEGETIVPDDYDMNCIASFEELPVDNTPIRRLGIRAYGNGRVEVLGTSVNSGSGLATFTLKQGQNVRLQAIPDAGWKFSGIPSDGNCRDGDMAIPAYDINCFALFEQLPVDAPTPKRTLGFGVVNGGGSYIEAVIDGGTITVVEALRAIRNLDQGKQISARIVIDPAYRIKSVSDGRCSTSFTVPDYDMNCIVEFERIPATPTQRLLVGVSGGNGTVRITINGQTRDIRDFEALDLAPGTRIQGQVIPDAGYVFKRTLNPACTGDMLMPDSSLNCFAEFGRP